MTEVRLRTRVMRSRCQRGQFWRGGEKSLVSFRWGCTYGVDVVSGEDGTKHVHTNGSFGSSDGCGTNNIFPLLSYFNPPSLASSSLRRSSSSTFAVPASHQCKSTPWQQLAPQYVPRPLTIHPLLHIHTRDMFQLPVLQYTQAHYIYIYIYIYRAFSNSDSESSEQETRSHIAGIHHIRVRRSAEQGRLLIESSPAG